jgi:Raf kinase inhibitor-like YbhB/YbcL family protein
MKLALYTALLSSTFLLSACRGAAAPPAAKANAAATPAATAGEGRNMTLKLTSTAFADGGEIPPKYTCDGADYSPPLAWSGVPERAKSLALVVDDPDAPGGTWVHWVIYQIPAAEKGFTAGTPAPDVVPADARQGKNDFGRVGYGGPCPSDGTHRYYFKLYALDTDLNLPSAATKDQLLKAVDGHVLAEGQLMGRYARQ